jgi:ubiquinone biosynthesis protein
MALVRQVADVALGARQVVKDLGRLQEIAQVLARHGLGWLIASVEVPGIGLLRRIMEDPGEARPTPERVTAVVADLGPTFVKLGQVLSTRDDLLPREYLEALAALQDDVGTENWDDIVAVFEQSLAGPPENLFAEFDPEPIATASIAQVHRAVTHDGHEVAVKVQRPGLRRRIETDLSILAFLARQVQVQLPEAGLFDLPGTVQLLRRALAAETDFRNEARNAEQFRTNFNTTPWIRIPEVYKNLSSADILTLEFMHGTPISKARAAGYDMKLVGERYLEAAFKMLLEDGFFHGDLHPGNVFVEANEELVLLDFGMVGRLSGEAKHDLVDLFFAVQRKDARTIARIYFELAIKPGAVDYAAWEEDVAELMEAQLFGKAMGEIQVADFLRDLMQRASKHGVRAPPTYTMFFKALITTEGLAKMLLPEVDPLTTMQPFVARMVAQQYSVQRLQQELMFWLMSFRYSSRRLPMVMGQVITELQEGKLRLRAVVQEHPDDGERRDAQVNRLAQALVMGALFVGSSLALTADVPRILGMPAPSTIGYVLCLLLGARMLPILK